MRSLDDIRELHLLDVTVEGEVWPVYAWAIEGPEGTILVDTGMIDSTPELDEEWGVQLREWPPIEPAIVINTHLHFDHCGGNRRFAGTPIYVQRADYDAVEGHELLEGYVRFPGATYELLEGEAEIVPGVRVIPTPGHSPGHQIVVVDTDQGLVVLGGDVTYSMGELIRGGEPNFQLIHDLKPRRVYLAHSRQPWEPK